MTAIVTLVHCNSPPQPVHCFGVEAHDDLVDALVYLILGLVQQGLELPQIYWIEA